VSCPIFLDLFVGIGWEFTKRDIQFCTPIDRKFVACRLNALIDSSPDKIASGTQALELVRSTVVGHPFKPDFTDKALFFRDS
jgi:hypothetical protein